MTPIRRIVTAMRLCRERGRSRQHLRELNDTCSKTSVSLERLYLTKGQAVPAIRG
jgi:hypothetical protein